MDLRDGVLDICAIIKEFSEPVRPIDFEGAVAIHEQMRLLIELVAGKREAMHVIVRLVARPGETRGNWYPGVPIHGH